MTSPRSGGRGDETVDFLAVSAAGDVLCAPPPPPPAPPAVRPGPTLSDMRVPDGVVNTVVPPDTVSTEVLAGVAVTAVVLVLAASLGLCSSTGFSAGIGFVAGGLLGTSLTSDVDDAGCGVVSNCIIARLTVDDGSMRDTVASLANRVAPTPPTFLTSAVVVVAAGEPTLVRGKRGLCTRGGVLAALDVAAVLATRGDEILTDFCCVVSR